METESSPRTGRLVLGLGIAVFAGVWATRLALVWFMPDRWLFASVPDDAFYYFQIARNIAGGVGSTFDGINKTNGYHPLWMICCSTVALLKDATIEGGAAFARAMLTFQLLLGGSAYALLAVVLAQAGVRLALVGLLLLFGANPYTVYGFTDGMESGAVLLFCAAFVATCLRWRPSETAVEVRDVAFGALLGIGFLARLDLALLAVASGVAAFAMIGWRTPRAILAKGAAWGVPFLLTFVVYTFLNSRTFDSLTPISGALKSSFPVPTLNTVALRGHFPAIVFGILVVAGGVWLARDLSAPRERRFLSLAVAVFVAMHLGHTIFFTRWGVHAWHFTAVWLLGATVAAMLGDRLPQLRGTAVAAIAAVLFVVSIAGQIVFLRGREDRAFQARSFDAAAWARDHVLPGRAIGMSDCGAFGFALGGLVVNLDGVVNNRAYQEALITRGLGEYLREQGVGYLAHHAVRVERVGNGYGTYDYRAFSRLYNRPGGAVLLSEHDEVYRSAPFNDGKGEKVFVVWKLPSRPLRPRPR